MTEFVWVLKKNLSTRPAFGWESDHASDPQAWTAAHIVRARLQQGEPLEQDAEDDGSVGAFTAADSASASTGARVAHELVPRGKRDFDRPVRKQFDVEGDEPP
jgi:hypothetical protein